MVHIATFDKIIVKMDIYLRLFYNILYLYCPQKFNLKEIFGYMGADDILQSVQRNIFQDVGCNEKDISEYIDFEVRVHIQSDLGTILLLNLCMNVVIFYFHFAQLFK